MWLSAPQGGARRLGAARQRPATPTFAHCVWLSAPQGGARRLGAARQRRLAMKQGLSLRVSQHLALTPQLQQSIRLLQLSTLELSQEVEQMLDDNPFLERAEIEAAEAEALVSVDQPVSVGDQISEWASDESMALPDATNSIAASAVLTSETGEFDSKLSESSDATASALERQAEGLADEPAWDGDGSVEQTPDDLEWGVDARAATPGNASSASGDDDDDPLARVAAAESLHAHLHAQAQVLRLNPTERAALYFLIESLNDDGYLEDDLPTLATSLMGRSGLTPDSDAWQVQIEELLATLGLALRWLQQFDPPGVGARDLAECLRLQLGPHATGRVAAAEPGVRELALALCNQPLAQLARRDVKRLTLAVGGTEAEVRDALALLARLEPKPGRRFADVQRQAMVPDVVVVAVGKGAQQRFVAQLNPDVMPRLRVHDVYANALRASRPSRSERGAGSAGADSTSGHAALQQRLQEARWFIKNIQQRFDTILRVSNAIVERQKNFFVHGELAMRPLVLREIADELGLHESTISRVTTAKYMATRFGTFELKYFFGSSLGTEAGGNASSTAVRALMRQLVAAEDPRQPLSDNQIADMLKEQGIECARRTVAKYREALRIAPANLRRAP